MSSALRIVNYAVNGKGVGHLMRLVAINRWLRRLAEAAQLKLEIYFLTSSEADTLLFQENFASFKVPSKTAAADGGLDRTSYLALARQWTWMTLSLLRPDLLIVDTFPRGAFGEISGAIDFCRRRAFVHRPGDDAFAEEAEFTAMLPSYDLILIPEHQEHFTTPLPPRVSDRLRFVGPVLARERFELLSREQARRTLAIPEDRFVVFLSSGGGGALEAAEDLPELTRLLLEDGRNHVLVAAGPLYRGEIVRDERVTWSQGGGVSEVLAAADVAISAAGYNTFSELMFAGIPTVFLPQSKLIDDQLGRALRAVDAGAAVVQDRATPAAVLRSLEGWRDRAAREKAAAAARALIGENHARRAAEEILRLVAPPGALDGTLSTLTDRRLGKLRALELDLGTFREIASLLGQPDDGPRVLGRALPDTLKATEDLVDLLGHHRWPANPVIRLLEAWLRRAVVGSLEERTEAARTLLLGVAPFEDWAAATLVIRALSVERELNAISLADRLSEYVGRLREHGCDLYDGLAHLVRAQGIERSTFGNRPTLEAALRTVVGDD
jgi:predicted glycosyltransferase